MRLESFASVFNCDDEPRPHGLKSLCGNRKSGTSAAKQFAEKVERIAVSGGTPPTSVVISAQARLPVPPKPGFRRVFPQAVKPLRFGAVYVVAKATTHKDFRVPTQTLKPRPTKTLGFSHRL